MEHLQDPPAAGRNVMGLAVNAKPTRDARSKPMILHRDLKPENSEWTLMTHKSNCR